MTTLIVKNFSCVEDAHLKLSDLTILIGPQASGKSVLSKLVYFFYDILSRQFRAIEEEMSLDEFKENLGDDFVKWFPPSAWGKKQFNISFSAGEFFVKVTPHPRRKGSKSTVRINFSPYLEDFYRSTLAEFHSLLSKRSKAPPSYEAIWRIRSSATRKLQKDLGPHYVNWQIFVPAGRSFFTSVGKAIAAFEYGGILDPVTLQFGKVFVAMRDRRRGGIYGSRRLDKRVQDERNTMMKELFGGNIKFDQEQEYVESDDGRKIPFGTMSSGQQELLPLWLAVEALQEGPPQSMIYIEEPEAHLFPSAQSQLVEFLASVVSEPKNSQRMLITTHSPYVMSQLNILLKAGLVAKDQPSFLDRIEKVAHRKNWLHPGSTSAYAIVGNRLKSIMDGDGLVDGEYLDEVSGDLSRDFSSLLEIEHADANKR